MRLRRGGATTTTTTQLQNNNNMEESTMSPRKDVDDDNKTQMKPLMVEEQENNNKEIVQSTTKTIPLGNDDDDEEVASNSWYDILIEKTFPSNAKFWKSAFKFIFCFLGLQMSYLTWGYMQELIMTSNFKSTPRVPDGKFPSAAFCVFSNRFLAVIVAMIVVRIKHGALFANTKAPLLAFTPCAVSNTMSSWSQYASLKYVSFPVQTVFKSSKIIPVMIMGKILKGTVYKWGEYIEALLITVGVAIFSIASKESNNQNSTELIGLIFLLCYITSDSFTSQWQSKIYQTYGKQNVDQYQMMLGVNTSAIMITTAGLIITGDFPIVYEFLCANPSVFLYNVITAITSASGQLFIYYTIKEFGPIVFTIIMTTRQMMSIVLSSIIFGHVIGIKALAGAVIVFSVLFYQIRRKYNARNNNQQQDTTSTSATTLKSKDSNLEMTNKNNDTTTSNGFTTPTKMKEVISDESPSTVGTR